MKEGASRCGGIWISWPPRASTFLRLLWGEGSPSKMRSSRASRFARLMSSCWPGTQSAGCGEGCQEPGQSDRGSDLPVLVERFGTTVDEIFVTSTELREK